MLVITSWEIPMIFSKNPHHFSPWPTRWPAPCLLIHQRHSCRELFPLQLQGIGAFEAQHGTPLVKPQTWDDAGMIGMTYPAIWDIYGDLMGFYSDLMGY